MFVDFVGPHTIAARISLILASVTYLLPELSALQMQQAQYDGLCHL
jgi:hypothetical protein